jgi:hypothetical protein
VKETDALLASAKRILSNREADEWQDYTDTLNLWFVDAVRGLAEAYIKNTEGHLNYTTAKCGHPTIAVGSPGSITRQECEDNPCDKCRADNAEKRLKSWEWVVERGFHVRWLAITGLPNWVCEDADGEAIGAGYSAEEAIGQARRIVEQSEAC